MKNPNPVTNGDGAMLYFVAQAPFLFEKITNLTLINNSIQKGDKYVWMNHNGINRRTKILMENTHV